MTGNERQILDKRQLLQIAGALSATGVLSSCGLFVRTPTPVCPSSPEVSLPEGHLTIDAHCHVFNGSDLQVNGFVSKILARQGGLVGIGARAIAPLLETVGWQVAPSGKAEVKKLASLGREFKECSPQQHISRIVDLRQQAFAAGRVTLQTALAQSAELQQFKQQVQIQGMNLADDEVAKTRFSLITTIEEMPPNGEDYKARLKNSSISTLLTQRSAQGILDFVLQNFQYRYVSVHDYLSTYDKLGNSRFVDLMLPSMVDYDFWLAKGQATPTGLRSQVDVMESISIVTGGRVHAFVPFDPLKQVAFELKQTTVEPHALAMEAIKMRGCVGIKLYPPMGFAAYGNSKLPRDFWRRPWLPTWTNRPDLGDRLDQAMLKMLTWCATNEVPIMAHTGLSNGPSDDFEALAASKYWSKALDQVKGLRISFGHFGGSSLGSGQAGMEHARGFMALMGAGAEAKGRNAYADAGYFVEGLTEQPQLLAALQQLYEQTTPGTAPLATRFMYGTDWEMTLAEGNVINSYLDRFVSIFNEMEQRPAIRSQGVSKLADSFFGLNAASWLGLRAGERSRERLDQFYKANRVGKPDWMRKLDATS